MEPVKPIFPPPDYASFKPLAQVLTQAKLGVKNQAAQGLLYEKKLGALVQVLQGEGIRRVSPRIRNGDHAIVLETDNHMMIRIAKDDERPRDDDYDVIQPLKNIGGLKGYRIEVLPKVHTLAEVIESPELCQQYGLKEPKKQAQAFIQRLIADNLHKGKFFYSAAPENVALLQDRQGHAVPVILDPGSLVDASHPSKGVGDAYPTKYYDHFAMVCMLHMDVFSDFAECMGTELNLRKLITTQMDEWAARHGEKPLACTEAQEVHLERLKLTRGELALEAGEGMGGGDDFSKRVGRAVDKRGSRQPGA